MARDGCRPTRHRFRPAIAGSSRPSFTRCRPGRRLRNERRPPGGDARADRADAGDVPRGAGGDCRGAWPRPGADLDQSPGRRGSSHQDTGADPIHHRRMVRYSAIFVVVFACSFSLASIDWLLTLDPRWTSSMYAVYVFSGVLVEGVAAVTLVVVLLHEHGHLADVVNANHLHDLGKLLLAFTTFWAYIWLSQYLLIWYSNLPEEAVHYVVRTGSGWLPLFAVNFLVNWLVPFCLLLPRVSKRSPSMLKWVAVLVL